MLTDRAQRHTGDDSFTENTANQEVQDSMHRLVEEAEGYVISAPLTCSANTEGAQLQVERTLTKLQDVANSGDESRAVTQLAVLVKGQQRLDARAVHQRQSGQPGSIDAQGKRIAAFDQVIAANAHVAGVIDENRRAAQTRTTIVSLGAIGILGLVIMALGLSARAADRRRRRIRRFSEGLQAALNQHDAYGLVKAHLERSVPGTHVAVFNRNNSADRLEPTTPVDEKSPLGQAVEGAKPDDCLAIRTARVSTGGTGADDLPALRHLREDRRALALRPGHRRRRGHRIRPDAE